MAGGTSALPWVVSSAISIFTVSMTGVGFWLSHRAQNKTTVLADTTERVKAEQHLVELLQAENDRIRDAWAKEMQKARQDCIDEVNRVKRIITEEITLLNERLAQEREDHSLTRHRYISDISALRGVVRDEITKAAATQVGEDVKDIMREAKPDPIEINPFDQIWPEQGDYT